MSEYIGTTELGYDEALTEVDLFTLRAMELADRQTSWEPDDINEAKSYLIEQSRILNGFVQPRANLEVLNEQMTHLSETYPAAAERAAYLRSNTAVQLRNESRQIA